MRCEQVMETRFESLQAGQTVQHAARRMRDFGVRFLPICKGSGRVVGVISDGDIIIRAVAVGRAPELCSVDEVMTKTLVTCGPGDDISHARSLMAAHDVQQVLVTDQTGTLRGILKSSALAMRPSSAPSPSRRTQLPRSTAAGPLTTP